MCAFGSWDLSIMRNRHNRLFSRWLRGLQQISIEMWAEWKINSRAALLQSTRLSLETDSSWRNSRRLTSERQKGMFQRFQQISRVIQPKIFTPSFFWLHKIFQTQLGVSTRKARNILWPQHVIPNLLVPTPFKSGMVVWLQHSGWDHYMTHWTRGHYGAPFFLVLCNQLAAIFPNMMLSHDAQRWNQVNCSVKDFFRSVHPSRTRQTDW